MPANKETAPEWRCDGSIATVNVAGLGVSTLRGLSLYRALNPVHDAAVDTENVEAVPTPLALTA